MVTTAIVAAAAAVRLQPMIDGRNGQSSFLHHFSPKPPTAAHTQTYSILYCANSLPARTRSTRTRTRSHACIQRSMNTHRSCARSPRLSVLLFMSMRAHHLPSLCKLPCQAGAVDLLQATFKQTTKLKNAVLDILVTRVNEVALIDRALFHCDRACSADPLVPHTALV